MGDPISLEVVRFSHDPASAIGYSLHATRIITRISLRSKGGWSAFRIVVVDTGAPVSLLPRAAWEGAERHVLGSTEIGGIAGKRKSPVRADLALVTCVLSDGARQSPPLMMHAYLAQSNSVPALLGMADILDRGRLVLDLPRSESALSFEIEGQGQEHPC